MSSMKTWIKLFAVMSTLARPTILRISNSGVIS
jgi:hypothetical protein